MSQVYYSVDVMPRSEARVRGELRELRLGQIGVSRFCADQQRVFRYAEAAKQDSEENFVFIFPVMENLYFEQRGKSGFVAPGGVALLNSSEYYEASCPDRFENLTLKVPCASLRSRLPGIDDACASFNHVNPAIVKAILGLTSPLLDPDAVMNNHQKDSIAETIVDLLELMLDSEPEVTEASHHSAAKLQRVRDFMRDNLGDHELTPSTVAKSADISVRYLHKLYAGSGTTFGKALLAMRLERANQLTKSVHSHATLQQIAFACGFNSQSHFSTAFKAHFGISPSLARNKST